MHSETQILINIDAFVNCINKCNLDEKSKRNVYSSLSISAGSGFNKLIAKKAGISRDTVARGIKEIKSDNVVEKGRIRRPGGGRKSAIENQKGLLEATRKILESETYGDPERVLYYTTKSLRSIADELKRLNFNVSHVLVGRLVEQLGYTKQCNQKLQQVGKQHPRRNDQFEAINKYSKAALEQGLPVISIDCKKKENLGLFKNPGQEYCKKGEPRSVLDHDFMIKELGKVAPYGVYAINDNTGFVNLGLSSDTAEFAGASIEAWWTSVGVKKFPNAKRIYVTCDGGGSNGCNIRLWKYTLARLSEKYKIEIQVSHFPPGTSKWNKIEHRLFCFISRTWAGQPLVDVETVVKLISSTKTKTGLNVKCVVDEKMYETGLHVPDEIFNDIKIERLGDEDLGKWNYIIRGFKTGMKDIPRSSSVEAVNS